MEWLVNLSFAGGLALVLWASYRIDATLAIALAGVMLVVVAFVLHDATSKERGGTDERDHGGS